MRTITDRVLYGQTITEGRFLPTGQTPRVIFQDGDTGRSFAIDEPTLFKNLLLLGGTGSGKTNILYQIVAQVQDWNRRENREGVSLLFDTKGDYIGHRGFFRPGDLIIGNDRRFRDQSASWNIFDEILADGSNPADYEPNAREIASILFKGRGSESQPFFCNAARDIFAAILICFVRQHLQLPGGDGTPLDNYELLRFLLQSEPSDLAGYFRRYPDMQGLLSYIGDGKNNQALGVFGELRSMLSDCFQGIFARKPSPRQPSFSIRRAIRDKGGRTIFLLYDLSLGETMTPLYRLLVDLALKEALSEHANGHTHIFLDELKLLPRITHLEDALNFGRSKGVSVVAGLQSVGQIYALYKRDAGQVILGGFGSIIALRTADFESRDYVTRLFGTNFTAYRYQSESNTPIDREREGNTVEPWHYRSLEGPGQAIVGLASQTSPFFFRFEKDMF